MHSEAGVDVFSQGPRQALFELRFNMQIHRSRLQPAAGLDARRGVAVPKARAGAACRSFGVNPPSYIE